ncbi:glutamate receptor, partial [Genlisea aurea]
DVVNVGAIFALETINGHVAEIAVNAAVEDVNSDGFLGSTKLISTVYDSKYSTFLSLLGGLKYMEAQMVAIIGPQVSETAHILSHLANELHVPMLSFTALDPSLSSLQYPYFVQTAPNDLFQMTAIADMLSYFGFRRVIALYTDDEQSRGPIASLAVKLAERHSVITYKAVLLPGNLTSDEEIMKQLAKIKTMESRVIILHSFAVVGLRVLKLANQLKMMEKGYVWIATAWLSTVLDSIPFSVENETYLKGVLTLRPHTPDSDKKTAFLSRWKTLSNGSIGLNPYGLYAYDTVWIIANAVKRFLDQGGNISFSPNTYLNGLAGDGNLNLGALCTCDAGSQVLDLILQTHMTGLTGKISFDSDKSVIRPAFEILNVVLKSNYKRIGYWSNYSGLSVSSPEILFGLQVNRSRSNQQLDSIIWPGNTTVMPRGWDFPQNGKELRIGVPNRFSFKAFAYEVNKTGIDGYSIDVFKHAVDLLPYALPYKLVLFGDGKKNPSYKELVDNISLNVVDGAVGDITIVTNRIKIVDFTQPYIESGLVVVVPSRKIKHKAWVFLHPFTPAMWVVTVFVSIYVGFVVWFLERHVNEEFRGSPKEQLVTIFWFGFSSFFSAPKENMMGALARVVLLIWLFVALIVTSSYTASLSAILTVEHAAPSITGIESLIMSNDRIGYQLGSFSEYYLIEQLNIAKSRLVPLGSPEEYADALTTGNVSAIVDERPYVDLFLANYCSFEIVGQEFTKSSMGFAFQRDSPLVVDLSTAILTLSEKGVLQSLLNKWLLNGSSDCTSSGTSSSSGQLQFKNFKGLFMLSGLACAAAVLIFICILFHKYRKY